MNLNLTTTPRRPAPAARAVGWYLCGISFVDLELLGDPIWIGLDLVAGIGNLPIIGEGYFAVFSQTAGALQEWGTLSIWRGRDHWQLRSRDGRTVVFPGHVAGTVVVTGNSVGMLAAAETGGLPCTIQG